MAFSSSVTDRESDKFRQTESNRTAVAVVLESETGSHPLTVESSIPALTGTMLTTTMNVDGTAVALPAMAMTGRRSISIFNCSDTDTLYIGSQSAITAGRALGTSAGWEIPPQETFNTDIQDTGVLYAIAGAGKTILVKILEVK